uniref:Guanine nucleotide-binding protein subunit gamma n=2 Tax=Crocodylia TaxID=1294634 RepID=A0A7M4FHE6_CROPO
RAPPGRYAHALPPRPWLKGGGCLGVPSPLRGGGRAPPRSAHPGGGRPCGAEPCAAAASARLLALAPEPGAPALPPPARSPSPSPARKHRMKEVVSNSTTNISQARKAVEQLKMEAYMDRIKVSKAAADLLAYCDAHIGEDPLIMPVPASENPFREKKLFCTIL